MVSDPVQASEVGIRLADATIGESPKQRSVPGWLVAALLILIILLGGAFRLIGVTWDDYTHLHPDERFLTMVVTSLTLPGQQAYGKPPDGCPGWGGYFDTACSPLNPYNHDFGLFVYGTFPLFLTRIAGEMVNQVGYDQIYLVGRVLSALFDLSTVLLIFFIGKRMYGVRAGLLGALFLAASVLDIQQSHYFTVDTFTNVPILIAFWFALDIADGRKWYAFIFAGLAFGLALAGRINIAPFAAVLVAAAALRAYLQAVASSDQLAIAGDGKGNSSADGPESLTAAQLPDGDDRQVIGHSVGAVSVSLSWRKRAEPYVRNFQDTLYHTGWRAFWGLAAAAIAALIFFRIFQPYAANGPSFISPHIPTPDLSRGSINFLFDVALSWAGGVNPKFADNMSYVSDLVAGKIDAPPGHQWTNRTPYVFPWENMVLYGLGPALGIAAWAGFLFALYLLLRYRRWEHLLIVVWVGITFAYTGQQWVKTMRYFLQIYPFLSLLGGWFIVDMWDRASSHLFIPSAHKTILRAGAAILAVIVIGYTLFWAGAFTTIYTRPYTRVAASRWFFDNVPPGTVIGNEHWDDPVPVRIDGKDPFGGMYKSLSSSSDGTMHWYDEDTPEKRVQAIGWLDEADYIVLTSNRLYASIPRLPMRYPMTTRYYQWLFDGTLGFQKIEEFTSRPQLFGITINDDNAEEAFTVYDHPKVIVFKKTPQYSHANTAALFNSIDLSEVYRFWPPQATQAPTALLLTPDQWDTQMRGGTWSQIFDPGDLINKIPVVGWLGMIEILGWLAFPIAFLVLRALADRGYIFSKPLGILLPAWGVWMLASLHVVEFSRWSILLVIFVIALVSAVIVIFRRRELAAFLRTQWSVVLVEEMLFLGFFGISLLIRFGNPDLWHPWYGGEKPMDFAYLNAVIKSSWFPPYDPWFAGGYINYYYFGQLITATLVRLSGIVPEVAYNLALPMFFGMTAMGAFSVVYNLVARLPGRESDEDAAVTRGLGAAWPALFFGLLGAIFVAIIGNLGEVVLIGQTFWKIGGGSDGQNTVAAVGSILTGILRVVLERQSFDVPIGWWYWNATRTIPETINEFPFFSFLYADLHAHVMALPFTLLVIGFAVSIVRRAHSDNAFLPFWPYWQISPLDVVEIFVAGLAVGALRAINFADYPTYLLVIMFALAIGEYARQGTINVAAVIGTAWRAMGVVIFATLLFEPFIQSFATAYLSTEIWKGQQTTLPQYLVVHGIFLFVITTYLILQFGQSKRALGLPRLVWGMFRYSGKLGRYLELHTALAAPATWIDDITILIVGGAVVLEAAFLLIQAGVFSFAFPLLVLAGLIVIRPKLAPERRLIALLVAAGLAMTLMVELITYKGDIGRMNTVFKFYLQVWVFFGIATAAGLAFVAQQAADRLRSRTQVDATAALNRTSAPEFHLPSVWWAAFGVLLFAGLLYPLFAVRAKVNDRFVTDSPAGLNGMDYMQQASYPENNQNVQLVTDEQAIQWLRENVQGSPVILEGTGPLYQWTSRVSIYTGLPTVIGWDWHQKQQRSIVDGAIIDQRINDVRTIYNTTSVPDAVKLLSRFRVSYIYVGQFERAFYDPVGLAKFDAMVSAGQLDLVYDKDQVKIYRLKT